ncbi:metal-sensitive transcriptional regulator [Streptomyces sp. NBC_01481]|nr:metal-sensitive transcriptional regulator [Streptomyces sp. NBC_01481]
MARLHKVEGQVRGITRMVDDDRYCIDVLTQISAVSRALQEVALGLLDDHARHCVTDAARSGPAEGEAKLDELALTLRRTLRL